MRPGTLKCGVFGLLTALLACACGARAPGCSSPPPPPAPLEVSVPAEVAATVPPVADAAPAPSAPTVRLIGRFEPPPSGGLATGAARFAWSGSAIEVRFTGPSLAMRLHAAPPAPHTVVIDGKPVTMDERSTAYAVEVDDRPPFTVDVSAARESYELATGLDPAQPHRVRVTREAEAFAGVHELLGIDLGPGGGFLPAVPRPLRIEVVGDSISCGYGVAGASKACPFSYRTERASLAYPARVGRALDADVTTVCWSGRGVLRNYDGSTTGTMPELHAMTLPEPPGARWDFAAAPAPDAVILNLGTNDFLGGAGKPLDRRGFEDAYTGFTRRLRELYPSAWIFVTTSPMLHGEQPSPAGPGNVDALARTALEHVVARRTRDGDRRIELIILPTDAPDWGCDGHPNAAMNARIADRIVPVVAARLAAPAAR